jgi:hypothetical protein
MGESLTSYKAQRSLDSKLQKIYMGSAESSFNERMNLYAYGGGEAHSNMKQKKNLGVLYVFVKL